MAIVAHGIGPRHPRATRNLSTRWWFWMIIAVALVLMGTAAWVRTRGLAAKAELEAAQAQVSPLKADVAAQKFSTSARSRRMRPRPVISRATRSGGRQRQYRSQARTSQWRANSPRLQTRS